MVLPSSFFSPFLLNRLEGKETLKKMVEHMQGGFERKPRVSAFDSSDISKGLERHSNSDGKQALRDVYECAVSKIDQVRNYCNYKD